MEKGTKGNPIVKGRIENQKRLKNGYINFIITKQKKPLRMVMEIKFFNKNGIPSAKPIEDFWLVKSFHNISISDNYKIPDIDTSLMKLSNKISEKLFESTNEFYKILSILPMFYSYAGIDAESSISRNDFEKLLNSSKYSINYKIIYYFDIENLVSSLRNLSAESYHLFCNFYEILNENSFVPEMHPPKSNTVMFSSGKLVTNIFSCINHLFINLASQLDFITKIAYELENKANDFSLYPKMKSNGILYSDSKKLKKLI